MNGHDVQRMVRESGLGRPLDPRDPSNLAAVAVTAATGLAGSWLARGDGLLPAGRAAVRAGGAVFAAWATAREIDPDHPGTAFAAMPLAAAGLALGRPSLAASFGTMLWARFAAGTVGLPLRPPDGLNLAAGTATGVIEVARHARARRPLGAAGWIVAGAAAVATGLALTGPAPRSTDDTGATVLEPLRVGTARAAAGASVALSALAGRDGVAATAPVAAAVIATAVRRLLP